MHEVSLRVGLVLHWQDSGFHGLHQIISWTERTVTYRDPESSFDLVRKGDEIYTTNKKIFLEQNDLPDFMGCVCDYPETHKYLHCVGKCYPVDQPLPKAPKLAPPKYCVKALSLIEQYKGKSVMTPHGHGKVIGEDYGRLQVKLKDTERFAFNPCYWEKEIQVLS